MKQAAKQKTLSTIAGQSGPAILVPRPLPKISIVTPSFNQGEYLEECMDSILSQNYPNLEYIVMDGGSRDRSVEIIKRFAKYLTHWQSQPDDGQYHAIQEGFDRTTGEIMYWLNSSDKLHSASLDTVAQVFSDRADVEWITGRPTSWNEAGHLIQVSSDILRWSREMYLNMEPRNMYIQQESTFWRRSLWNKSGARLDLELKHAGDFELWARFFQFAQLHPVDAMLGGFRMHTGQKTSVIMHDYLAEVDVVVKREKSLLQRELNPNLLSAPPLIDTVSLDGTVIRLTPEFFSYFRFHPKEESLPEDPWWRLFSMAGTTLRQRRALDVTLSAEAERMGVTEVVCKLRDCEQQLRELRQKKNLWIFNPVAWRVRSQRNRLRHRLDGQKQIILNILENYPKFPPSHHP